MGQFTNRLRLHVLTLALLAGLAPASFAAGELEPKTLRDFSRGLVTSADPTLIPDNAAQDLANVDLEDGSIRKRRGTIKANSTEIGDGQDVRFVHEYIDQSGNFWLISVSSNTIYKSNDGGATNTVGTNSLGVLSTSRFQAANAFGKVYLVSGTTNTITFNGTSFAQHTQSPLGNVTAFFAGRLWIGMGSTLYGSRVSDDTDWTDSGVDDADAFSAVIRYLDGYSITALVPFGPDLLVFKSYSIDRLVINNDGLTFSLVPVTSNLGTNFPETVKVGENRVMWLAHDGFYSYNGSVIKRISENLQPTIAPLSQLASAARSYSETTQTQFQAGTSTGTSANVVADSVVLSTWTATDTSGTDYAAGSLTNVTTQTVSGALYLSTNSNNVLNHDFEDGASAIFAAPDNWILPASGFGTANGVSFLAQSGTRGLLVGEYTADATVTVSVLDADGVFISTISSFSTTVLTNNTWVQRSLTMTPFAGRNIRVRFVFAPNGPTPGNAATETFLANGDTITFWIYDSASTGAHDIVIDNVENGRSTIYAGSFTSRGLDSSFTTPKWLPSTPTYTANGHTVTFQTESSTNSVNWQSPVSWSPGSAPASADRRYIRYSVSISTASSGSGMPFINDVTLAARNTSGRYVSSAINTTGASSWLPLTGNSSTNDGSLTYEIYTDTNGAVTMQNGNVVAGSFISSQTISNGSIPTIATAAFAFFGSTFSITVGTQAPQLDDFTVSWAEGNSSLFPAGLYWDRVYYCALAVNSATENDTIFNFDRNDSWTLYTGLPVRSFTTYRNRPYFGAGSDGFIVRMQVDDRYRDYDDAAISAFWLSKDFDFGYPLTSKSLLRYYVTGEAEPLGNATFGYGVERGTLTSTAYSLNQTGFFRQVVKPTSLLYSEGIQHRFRISDSTLDGPMSILSITGRWNVNTNP